MKGPLRSYWPAPLIFAGGFVLGLALEWAMPLELLRGRARWIAGGAMVAAGIALGLWSLATMRRHRTSPMPFRPAAALVTDGPYGISRHPMYVSMVLFWSGAAILAHAPWALMLMPIQMTLLHLKTMLPEERYLAEHFAAEFAAYRARVRPWL